MVRRVIFMLTRSGFANLASVYMPCANPSQIVRNFFVNPFRMSNRKQGPVRNRFAEEKAEDLEELLSELEIVTCS